MNTKNLWIASISGALLTALVSNVPVLGLINCLLCAGFWGGAIFSVWLYRRINGTLIAGQGLPIGALTGLLAGLLGIVISFGGHAGIQSLFNAGSQVLPLAALQSIQQTASMGILVFAFIGLLFNLGFGAIGGLIGEAIFKDKSSLQVE